MTDDKTDELAVKIEEFSPEEMGWVHKGGNIYERPDGKFYVFAPNRPHLIAKLLALRRSSDDR